MRISTAAASLTRGEHQWQGGFVFGYGRRPPRRGGAPWGPPPPPAPPRGGRSPVWGGARFVGSPSRSRADWGEGGTDHVLRLARPGGRAMTSAAARVSSPAAPRTLTASEIRRVIFASSSLGTVFEWYDFYLYGSLAGDHQQALLLRRQPDRGVHLRAARLRRGLRGAPVRRARVRPARRPRRPQVHLPDHDRDHGPLDLGGRLPPHVREHRARGAGDAHPAARAAGTRARRRVRRCRDVRRRARAGRASAARTRRGSRPPPRSGSFSRCS